MLGLDRRQFLKASLLSGAIFLPFPRGSFRRLLSRPPRNDAPLARVSGPEFATQEFTGDTPTRFHQILWNKSGYLADKKIPSSPDEIVDVVVLGGGVSGLMSAYELREFKPVILEGQSQFGGNSRGEVLGSTHYSIGAAFLSPPEEGSSLRRILSQLGLLEKGRIERGEESFIEVAGKLKSPFWSGVTDPERASDFKKVAAKLQWILTHDYPTLPFESGVGMSRERLDQLDSLSFREWSERELGTLHPDIEEYFRVYLWSSLGGSADELSAAQVLFFLCADMAGTFVLPGGNSAITEALYREVRAASGENRVRSNSIVIDVRTDAHGVTVLYETSDRELRSIRAKVCINALPKFVAARLMDDLEPARLEAMKSIRYRSYLVANVIVDKKIPSPCFELFRLGAKDFSDACFGTWADHDLGDRSVLSLYKTFPYDGARTTLIANGAHDSFAKAVRDELPQFLRALDLNAENVKAIRMTRFGHALPLAEKGFIAKGGPELVAAPHRDRVYFVNQDNWVSPCIETCTTEASRAAAAARKLI